MIVRTDDDVWRARLIYLGPPGYTLPWQWAYTKYALYFAFIVPSAFVAYLITGSTMAVSVVVAVTGGLAELFWRSVDADVPVRKYIWTVLRDLHRDKPRVEQRRPAFSSRHITRSDPPSLRRVGPSVAVIDLRRSRRDEPQMPLALRGIAGHTTTTANTVTAWYRIPPTSWAFRPDFTREADITAVALQYAALAGCRLHLRRTNVPFPIGAWAREHTPAARPIGTPDMWSTHVTNTAGALAFAGYTVPLTLLGVTLPKSLVGDGVAEWMRAKATGRAARTDEDRVTAKIDDFTKTLAGYGLYARPASEVELAKLVYQSIALGLDLPDEAYGTVDPADVLSLTDSVERFRTPLGSTVKLVHRLTGQVRHVAVVTFGRMETLDIPRDDDPWLHLVDELPFPVELSSRVDVLGPGVASKELYHRLLMIQSQQGDFRDHRLPLPPDLERRARRAQEIGDEINTGQPVDATRIHGWHRIAVSGATEAEALDQAQAVKKLFIGKHRTELRNQKGQWLLLREFIPGEPDADTGCKRRMPVKMWAAAVPQAAPLIGDRRGDLIGHTVGAGRLPVFWDAHFPMEVRERSGLAVFAAEPGAGKSTLIGAVGYLAARRGVQVTILDPSGPLAALCGLPELAGHARVVNLTGAQPGMLAPYALIQTPSRAAFDGTDDGVRQFENAIKYARGERRALVQDILAALLPAQVAKSGDAITALQDAIRAVPLEETSTLDDVVNVLRGMPEPIAARIAGQLMDAADMPLAGALFGRPSAGAFDSTAALTVITMAGLRLPEPTVAREDWTVEEAHAVPILHTAYRLAVRRCYGGDMNLRKMVALDEAHFMQGWPSGRSFLVRLARDCRKWNLAALVASQNPDDILGLDVQNLVSTVFVGRIARDKDVAEGALRLLRVEASAGYEQTLAGLSQVDAASTDRLGYREFLMRDIDGRVQKVRVNFDHVPGLLAALNTTPGGRQ